MFALSSRSRAKLADVHPDLVRVVELAIQRTEEDFLVAEGVRSITRQRELVVLGKSQTLASRHLTGHAVDLWVLVDGKVNWEMERYRKLAAVVLAAAKECNLVEGAVEWGGNWTTFKDGPHFQLSKKFYPDEPGRRQWSKKDYSSLVASSGKTKVDP